MLYALYTIHVIICLFLIMVVLLQQGKGADLSVFGGGGTQTAFGARGAATLLHKLTVFSFIAFIFTTMGIGVLKSGGTSGSAMRGVAVEAPEEATNEAEPMLTFGDDLEFLRQHNDVILLASGDAQVAVVAAYQGRVMTSTSGGLSGLSFGWLNREHIAAAERVPHINVFGGEDRFWLGPEGGQFSIFFKGDDAFDLEHWQTPEPIDWGAWDVTEEGPTHARFRKTIELVNYSGTTLALTADRTIRLLDEADRRLDIELGDETRYVAFESENTITNSGDQAWSKEARSCILRAETAAALETCDPAKPSSAHEPGDDR